MTGPVTMRGHTIDSFADYSPVAMSCMPTRPPGPPPVSSGVTFYSRTDEELFRDLFGVEADAEARDTNPFDQVVAVPQKRVKPNLPAKGIKWTTGATLTNPFGPALSRSSAASSPRLDATNNTPSSPRPDETNSLAPPSLNAPPPRVNVAELMTTRPETNDDSDAWGTVVLTRVLEADEDDDDEERGREASKSSRLIVRARKAKRERIHQQPLQFLDKLDLKTLLAQPRPDIKRFYPSSTMLSVPVHALDPRVEEDDQPGPRLTTWKPSGRRDTSDAPSRLAHMELTYGTTASEPRKARKQTLTRLSNPISGHTSTLQALSPEQRKKREAESSWQPSVVSPLPVQSTGKKKLEKPLTTRLSEASSVYEAAATANQGCLQKPSTSKPRKLVKESKPRARSRIVSRNQNQDPADEHRARQPKKQSLDERKSLLKKKLVERQALQRREATPTTAAVVPTGATFLTQHEECEGNLTRPPIRGAGRTFKPAVNAQQRQAPIKPPPVRKHPSRALRPTVRLERQQETARRPSRDAKIGIASTIPLPKPNRVKHGMSRHNDAKSTAAVLLLLGENGPKTPARPNGATPLRGRPTTLPAIRNFSSSGTPQRRPTPTPPPRVNR